MRDYNSWHKFVNWIWLYSWLSGIDGYLVFIDENIQQLLFYEVSYLK